MTSESEKFYRRKNRDLRAGRIAALIIGIPFALALGTCVGLMAY